MNIIQYIQIQNKLSLFPFLVLHQSLLLTIHTVHYLSFTPLYHIFPLFFPPPSFPFIVSVYFFHPIVFELSFTSIVTSVFNNRV